MRSDSKSGPNAADHLTRECRWAVALRDKCFRTYVLTLSFQEEQTNTGASILSYVTDLVPSSVSCDEGKLSSHSVHQGLEP